MKRWTVGLLEKVGRYMVDRGAVKCAWCGSRACLDLAYAVSWDSLIVHFKCRRCRRRADVRVKDAEAWTDGQLIDSLPPAFFNPFPLPKVPPQLAPVPVRKRPEDRGRRLPPAPSDSVTVWLV